ncbi:hypothetical protein VP01_907g6 [Puccinia sorghi]|uniref:Uncharacterized protein n=1 Tax=Puccinia sorghi TaxID=27349 RepID=A0A0L6U7M5_9BASI|nr:hypothetical protein VP01_907g6 [Puccinia sorghi]
MGRRINSSVGFTIHLGEKKLFSELQLLTWDPFMTLILLNYEDTNILLETHLNVPSVPSLGLIVSPYNSSQMFFQNSILEDEAETIYLYSSSYPQSFTSVEFLGC